MTDLKLKIKQYAHKHTHRASGKIPEIIVTLLVHTKKKKTMGKVMKVFKTLMNELFGTKREYKVEGLGIFTCKVCDWWRDKCYLWSGAVQLPFYSVETLVLIEGDASAPFSRQLLELQVLLQNWVPMAEQLDSMLSSKSQQKHKEKIYGSWQNDFYPYTIVPAVLYSDSWEIVFYRNSGVNYNFTVFWKDNRVQDLRLGGS